MTLLLVYLFIGAVYAAFSTRWLERNHEDGSSLTIGLFCFVAWPVVIALNFILSARDEEE